MIVTAIKTPKIHPHDDLFQIIKSAIPKLKEKSVVVVTSKIVAICEGRVVPISEVPDRDEMVKREADLYLPREYHRWGFCLTINHNTLIASAGIDESNGEGNWILWPEDLQKSVNQIRDFLVKEYNLKEVGVVMTDSHLQPLRWGTHGVALAHSGFKVLNDYRGKPDIFGHLLKVSQANISEGIAAAAVMCMGEGNEQTPLAVVEDAAFVQFQDRNPTQGELDLLQISVEADVFAPIFMKAEWIKGKKK